MVEDSENDALLLVRELKKGGYEPDYERVETPEAMEKALAASEWDVVVSDYRLPRFGAAEALRVARDAGSDAPFIVVSGKVGEEAAVEVMKAGAYDFLTRPGPAVPECGAGASRGREASSRRRGAAPPGRRPRRGQVRRELPRRPHRPGNGGGAGAARPGHGDEPRLRLPEPPKERTAGCGTPSSTSGSHPG